MGIVARGTKAAIVRERHTSTRAGMPARPWRPAEHTRQRAIFHDLGNAPYRRRESFDAEKLADELANLRRANRHRSDDDGGDDDGGDDGLKRERALMTNERVRALETRARDASEVARRETEKREMQERALERANANARRGEVSERLKRHAEREVLELTRELETVRMKADEERDALERCVEEMKATHESNLAKAQTAEAQAAGEAKELLEVKARLEEERDATTKKNAALEGELASVGTCLKETEASLKAVSEAKASADDELSEAREEMARLRDELERTAESNRSNERELRESRRKAEAFAAAVHSARGNDSAARAMMRDSVLTFARLEDAANSREIQILKEHHAAIVERMQEEFAVALADVKANTGAVAHSTVDESQRVKRTMKGMEEDAREAVRNARRREEEANAVAAKLREELVMTKARLNSMIEAGEGKLNHASIRDAQASRLAAAQAQAICRDLQAELEAEHESAEAARHEASETAHKYFALRDKYEQREALVNHQKETISALKRDNERSGGEIDELKARCKELKLCLRDNEMTYLNRQDLTEEVEHLNRIIADANVRDRERAIELQREQERADNYAERLERCEAKLNEETNRRIQIERTACDADSTKVRADSDALRAEAMTASAVLLEAEVLRLARINEQAETRVAELEGRVEQLIEQADALASSQNPNQSIRYLEKLRDEREMAEKDAEEAGKAVQNMKAALQFVVCARRETRDKVVQYAREARKTGRIYTEAPGLPQGVSADIWARVVETVARLNLDAVEC